MSLHATYQHGSTSSNSTTVNSLLKNLIMTAVLGTSSLFPLASISAPQDGVAHESQLEPDLIILRRFMKENDERILVEGVQKYPDSAALHAALAVHYRIGEAADFKSSEIHYKRALEIDPNDDTSHFGYAEILAGSLKRPADAEVHYRRAMELAPNSGEYFGGYAMFLFTNGRNAGDVEGAFKKALGLASENTVTHRNYGIFLLKTGRRKEAGQHFEKAIALGARDAFSFVLYGNHLLEPPANLDGAERAYKKAVEMEPNNRQAHLALASFAEAMRKNYDVAEKHYTAAFSLGLNDDEAHNDFAVFLTQVRGKHTEAAKHYEAAIKIAPNASVYVGNYSQVLVVLKRWDDAEREASRAWELAEDKGDDGAAEIAFTRWILARRKGASGEASLGRLKTMIEKGYERGEWELVSVINAVSPELSAADREFARLLAAAILDEKMVKGLAKHPLWKSTKAIPVEREWK